MKYKIDIAGMHCSGCSALMKMSLEDGGLKNVEIDPQDNTGMFDSVEDNDEVKKMLNKVFEELSDYNYNNLVGQN
ncbi:MAG: hypothetical protein US52_C0033G0003 [candidate division WS6 bacterium GW2011_GWA2_37_6]|uniref:Uncharacterized protein n=1 Tax=candidate division WS6 bacterium GW2011_GWA2_37_6 TaxID=1619087 RepID=A0A0G0K3H5_9BACT|nr:MAG: hypothetical protein US52_C0033G0003 [candidate division WS6 bacterium GW2011_GWA2_37_6]